MPKAPESFAGLELPKFADRLPDLQQALREVGSELMDAGKNQSYLPAWEDLYSAAHGLKGVLKLLSCPDELAKFIVALNETLVSGLAGNLVCRETKSAGEEFQRLATLLQAPEPEKIPVKELNAWITNFTKLYKEDVAHSERLKEIPAHLFYVNEFVSKKAREISLLNLNHCVVEDEILLDHIPLWRTQLRQALICEEFGRGILVNFLPFLSPEGSRQLKVWAWVAAASHSRASLKQRIKEVMPNVQLSKV
jgi:hypothetical protein